MLKWSESKTRRVRNLAGIKITRQKKINRDKHNARIPAPPNLLREYWQLKDNGHPEKGYTFTALTDPSLNIWVQDFTYIHWHGKLVYLAATMNLSARFVVGWSFGLRHTADLICNSLEDAMFRFNSPDIVHNDRESEYMSEKHYKNCIERLIFIIWFSFYRQGVAENRSFTSEPIFFNGKKLPFYVAKVMNQYGDIDINVNV